MIFITGTDTGVGKTTLTALLLCHLRRQGRPTLAVKPFCTGGRQDAELFLALQQAGPPGLGPIELDDLNPFHFPEPLAPLAAARKHRRRITLRAALDHLHGLRAAASTMPSGAGRSSGAVLLVEGAGGVLSPLGEGCDALALIAALNGRGLAKIIVVARNALGTLNHTRLTVGGLRAAKVRSSEITIVLMNPELPDESCASNGPLLRELLAPVRILTLPFLGPNLAASDFPKLAQRHSRTLGAILGE